ncbi:cell division protein, partial [Streptomyces sp. SID5785]|nr:cell division protein [Streptomyces sp. SID5785]
MTDREPPRRRVPAPARPAGTGRPGPQRRPGPGSRPPVRRPRPSGPKGAAPLRLGSPRPRLRMVSLGLTLVLLVFVVRLLQVQGVDANAYAAKAELNRYVSHTIAAERGGITDRSGVALATSVDAYDITADPTLFTEKVTGVKDAP